MQKQFIGDTKGYVIGNEFFKTKTAIRDRVRQILGSYSAGQALNPYDAAFALGLLQNHERAGDKIGCGVASIIVHNPPGYAGKCLWVVRHDGTTTDFSYEKCLRPATAHELFYATARASIEDQMQAFRDVYFQRYSNTQQRIWCPYITRWIEKSESHVDHVYPREFARLVRLFIRRYRLNIEAVELAGLEDGAIGRRFADTRIILNFKRHHYWHARLRVVSRQANLSLIPRGVQKPDQQMSLFQEQEQPMTLFQNSLPAHQVLPPVNITPEIPADDTDWIDPNDTDDTLLQRIERGIAICQTAPTDALLDGLCILMLNYEDRFGGLPEGLMERVEALPRPQKASAA